jgi:hypothetical protein
MERPSKLILRDVNAVTTQGRLMQCIILTVEAKTQMLRDQPIQRAALSSYRANVGKICRLWPASCSWLGADKRGSHWKEQMPLALFAARLCRGGSKVGTRVQSLGKCLGGLW